MWIPKRIGDILSRLSHSELLPEPSAAGRATAFECGTNVQFSIRVEGSTKVLEQVGYSTNGCGYMTAGAEIISESTEGRKLTELQGSSGLERTIVEKFGCIPRDRAHCVRVLSEAFRDALAVYRSRLVEEFRGESVLICTCFGVDEETILRVIDLINAKEAADISATCNAGSGCGSCRLLIQELIEHCTQPLVNDFF